MFSFIQSIKQHIEDIKNTVQQNALVQQQRQQNAIQQHAIQQQPQQQAEIRDCIIYIRVSSEDQNYDAQKYTCEEYAFNNRLYIKKIYEEKVSAYKGFKQMQLAKLVRENKDCILIVFSVDRFSRNSRNSEELIKLMESNNINLISVKDNINLKTAFGKHEFRKLISIAQYESELISERVKNSIKYRKENGIPIGQIPFGFTKFNTKIVKDNNEQNVIKFIIKHSKTKSTPEKLSKDLFTLLKKLGNTDESMVPITITIEDEEFEYRELRQNENINITYGIISDVLNDYEILKKGKKWTKSSVYRVFKNAVSIDSFKNLRV